MAAMKPERWKRLKELFNAAIDMTESDRSAFIVNSCEGDSDLQRTLESMLEHSLETGSSFDQALNIAIDIEDSIPTNLNLHDRTLGSYRILEKIGHGGMGEVFRAIDTELGRDVAIKVLPEVFVRNPESLARFEREARVLAALNHPNIATIHNIGKIDGTRFLVLELVEGQTLRSRLEDGPLTIQQVLRLATQIADGLAKAHEAGITHRDLKPDNLMITEDGTVKILDFGLAKTTATASDRASSLPTEPQLRTEPGRVMGTTAYMSPEQARGSEVDHRSDQFALGSVLYEMVTGQRAFGGETSADTLVAIMRREPERPSDFGAQVPAPLRSILERCLAKEPGERYESTLDLANDLRNLSERFPGISPAESTEAKLPLGGLTNAQRLGAALVVAALITVGILWWLSKHGPEDDLVVPTETAALERQDPASRRDSLARSMSPESASIAVLPLENLGPANQEYFADGMTDALITHLAKIKALKVISRTSVIRYKDQEKSLPEIGRELDVDTVLVGSVLHAADRVRISTQLIEAATDRSLWAESYEQDLEDILSLQAEVAQAIARAVRVTVDPKEEARIATLQTVEPEAYKAYLMGLAGLEAASLGNSNQADSLRASLGHFEEAIRIEPEWAVPYAKTAGANYWLASLGGTDLQAEFYPKAKAAALRALELDSAMAEAHSIVGRVLLHHEWDWAGAEEAHLRALELDPNHSNWGYARFLRLARRWDEAFAEFKKVKERYPLSPLIPQQLGLVYLCADRLEEAELETRILLETFPESPLGYQLLGQVLLATSRYEEAVTALEQSWEHTVDSNPWMVGFLPIARAKAGDIASAREMLHDLEQNGYDWFPGLYITLGEEGKAMAQIEEAFAKRRDILLTLQCSLEYERFMEIPRFREIVEAIGFPD